jgi:hypothetical protein
LKGVPDTKYFYKIFLGLKTVFLDRVKSPPKKQFLNLFLKFLGDLVLEFFWVYIPVQKTILRPKKVLEQHLGSFKKVVPGAKYGVSW